MKTVDEQIACWATWCRHFVPGELPGIDHGPVPPRCEEFGIYLDDGPGDVCRGVRSAKGVCESYSPDPEKAARLRREVDHADDCMRRNVSTCCEAPLDESQVIARGRYRGHGPRFCTKCGKLVYMV